jgi:hypothetical protein
MSFDVFLHSCTVSYILTSAGAQVVQVSKRNTTHPLPYHEIIVYSL